MVTANLLPLPGRNEQGEGWSEGKTDKNVPEFSLTSPRPSPLPPRERRGRRQTLRCLFFLLGFAAWQAASSARAHPLIQNSAWVSIETNVVVVRLFVSAKEAAVTQNIPAETNSPVDAAAIGRAFTNHAAHVLTNFVVRADGVELAGTISKIEIPGWLPKEWLVGPESVRGSYDLVFPIEGRPPAEIVLQAELLRGFPYAPGVKWQVSHLVRLQRPGEPVEELGLLRPGEPMIIATGWRGGAIASLAQRVESSRQKLFGSYLRHGVHHILTGFDHLLFVTALVLAARGFWDLFKVVGMFTLAHSVTLTLAALNLVRLPDWFVEPVIAASIIFVAVENIFFTKNARGWRRLAVAFSFGLVHGLGFAGGLRDTMQGLPDMALGLALLAFSLGVELGHQFVVLPEWALLRFTRGKISEAGFTKLQRGLSALVALVGVWFFWFAVKGNVRFN